MLGKRVICEKDTWFNKLFLTDVSVLRSSHNIFRQIGNLIGTQSQCFLGAPNRQC